nr:10139_t:CDS:1 [Entrophospora candida]
MYGACKNAGYNFSLSDIKNWLNKQAIFQIHKPRPKFIPYASFINITVPMEVIQADILYMPFDKVGGITYMFCLTCIDLASRYKGAVPIGTTLDVLNMEDFSLEGVLTSSVVANAFEKLLNDPNNLFRWDKLKLVITDKGSEFKGHFEKLLKKRKIKNQKANSKNTMGPNESFNKTLSKKLFQIQDAQELLLPIPQRSRIWKKNLSTVINILNNTVTRLIGMTPTDAVKKEHVYAKSSKPRKGPIGFVEVRLTYKDSVRYLLKPGELEGGKLRATGCNWSPQVYHIKKALIQKNQPILYWLIEGPKRSFVQEELMVVNDVEFPPDWILKN